MKEIMSRYTDKLPVIGTRSRGSRSPPSTRPVGRGQIVLPAIQSRRQHHAHAKLTKDQLTSDRTVRPSPCLPPLTYPGRHRDPRQTTFKGTHDQGSDNHSNAALTLQQRKEKLLSEIERERELKSLQKEDERYLEHLRKNLADLTQETDRTTRETREISVKSDEVRETLGHMRREMVELEMKHTRMMYNSQRLQDACAKLEAQMAREMSEVMRNGGRNMSKKMAISTVLDIQNSSVRFIEQSRIARQEASVSIIPEAVKSRTQSSVPVEYVETKLKTKSRLRKLAAKILGRGKMKSEEGIGTLRNESPIQFMKRKSKKFMGGFIAHNRVSPIPEED